MALYGDSEFVGRTDELKLLLDGAERALAAQTPATAAILVGEAGVGKSRLLREYALHTPLGRVAVGSCPELGIAGLPLAPFISALRPLARECAQTDPQLLEQLWELRRFLPELGSAPAAAEEDNHGRLFGEVRTLLDQAAAAHGLALVIEDVHWADRATRDLLVFLLHNLTESRVQLLLSCRSDDLHHTHPMRRLLPELVRIPEVMRLEVNPLSRIEVASQVSALRGAAAADVDVDLVYARSGGNPLFVESFLAYDDLAHAPVPETPRELLLGPVRALDSAARRVVHLVAVAGGRVDHALLAAVTELGEDDFHAAVSTAVDANAVRVEGAEYVLRHSLLAEAVYDALLPGERGMLHRRFAETLERGATTWEGTRVALRAAHHRYAAHDLPEALAAAWSAAQADYAVLSRPEVLSMLERVLELWDQVPEAAERIGHDRIAVQLLGARAAIAASEPERGADLATAGLDTLTGGILEQLQADQVPRLDAVRIAALLHARGEALRDRAYDRAIEDLRQALRVLPADHAKRPKLMATLAADLMVRWCFRDAIEVADRTLELARTFGDQLSEAEALITLGTIDGGQYGHFADGLAQLRHARQLAQRNGWARTESRARHNEAAMLQLNGHLHEALALYHERIERERELGLHNGQTSSMVGVLCQLGRLDEAEEQAVTQLRRVNGGKGSGGLYSEYAKVALRRGDLSAARERLAQAAHMQPDDLLRPSVLLSRELMELRLLIAEGELDRALRLVHRLRRKAEHDHELHYIWAVLERGAQVWRAATGGHLGAESAWDELHAELSAEANQCTVAGARLRLRREVVLGLLSTDPAETLQRLGTAASRADEIGIWPVSAEVRVWAAQAAHRVDDSAAAGALLQTAHHIAAEYGFGATLRSVAELRRSIGITDPAAVPGRVPGRAAVPGPAPANGLSGLTRREVEVLRLVAAGRSNPEIAAELSIAVKTVSVHVSNLLGKLEVTNRNAAAVKARELGVG